MVPEHRQSAATVPLTKPIIINGTVKALAFYQ